jgi:para-aminobenzoate synthetase/4-amino-4-deoxychorismate lyase
MRRRLTSSLTPAQMLRFFRRREGLFGLLGLWHESRPVIGFSPAERLPADADPFAALSRLPVSGGDVGFGGGWVGYLGYRLGGRLERVPSTDSRPVATPDFSLAFYDHVLVRDQDGWWFEGLPTAGNHDRLETAFAQCEREIGAGPDAPQAFTCTAFEAEPDGAGHRGAVATTLDHLVAGDIFQANICRRFEADFSGDPLDAFCAGVERLAPAYAAFLRTPDGAIASLSPELFLRRTGREVRTAPIKGTAPLTVDAERLTTSAKDRAENVMIVDLMRNDLGRVCVPGSVRVEEIARAERRTGVWHLVSDVVGTLSPGADDTALVRATFPPGSVTGAPKIRAMEVIHEVETTGREAYTGAIGYASPAAGLELNVTIRTFEFAAGRVWFGVGGGVVVDSTPEGETHETLVKAHPLVSAIGARLAPEHPTEPAESAEPEKFQAPGVPEGTARPEPAAEQPSPLAPTVDVRLGMFTTLLVDDGEPVELDAHLARLGRDVQAGYGAALPPGLPRQVELRARGLAGRHRLRIVARPTPSGLAVEITTTTAPSGPKPPLRLTPLLAPGGLGEHKYVDRRRLDGVAPALVVDVDGSVLETWKGSIFVVTDDAVHTPALDGRLLPGITRQRVLETMAAAGIPVIERRIPLSSWSHAVEVFATGSIDGVRPVTEIVGLRTWPPGALTDWLAHRLSTPTHARSSRVAADRPGRGSTPGAKRDTAPDQTLLLVDNYDSFVYNLDQYLRELGAHTHVVRNDALDLDEIAAAAVRGDLHGIVISPGPGAPADAGLSTALVERLGAVVPILGVCLGHQCIAAAYGARVVAADTVVHGKPSLVHHDGRGVYAGLDGPMVVGRYHSLVVAEETLPTDLVVAARTGTGSIMGVRHRSHSVEGLQFHPESILTRSGHRLLATFLRGCSGSRPLRDTARP